ncbi:hypothetical protein TrRE_jg1537, partial [Triparma retinervis]
MASKFHVQLSEEWLTSCLSSLPSPLPSQPAEKDFDDEDLDEEYIYEVYTQILNNDIRDTVNSSTTNTAKLRNAIKKSIQQAGEAGEGSRVTVGEDFMMMVQVDELVDVSMNAEHRAERGASRTQGFANPGYYRGRCLKLAMSDGWVKSGPSGGVSGGFVLPVVAMEVSPIPDLSANTLAGCKVVLKGPFDVGAGVAMLGPGNVAVLGGSVDALVAMQEQAVEAGRRKYVGGTGGAT